MKDHSEAVRLYRLAAAQGYANAQIMLGYLHENGQSVLQDNILAHMYYNLGAANGNELGGTDRDKIAKRMIPQDISKAQAMARECMSSNYKNCGY